jgi:hypothetical protein
MICKYSLNVLFIRKLFPFEKDACTCPTSADISSKKLETVGAFCVETEFRLVTVIRNVPEHNSETARVEDGDLQSLTQSESHSHHITYNCNMRNWSPLKNFIITYVGLVYDSFSEYSLFLWYTNTAIFGLHCAGWGEVCVERNSSSSGLVAKLNSSRTSQR